MKKYPVKKIPFKKEDHSLPPVSQSPISQEHRNPSLYFLVRGAPSRRNVASTFLILSLPEAKFRAGALDR